MDPDRREYMEIEGGAGRKMYAKKGGDGSLYQREAVLRGAPVEKMGHAIIKGGDVSYYAANTHGNGVTPKKEKKGKGKEEITMEQVAGQPIKYWMLSDGGGNESLAPKEGKKEKGESKKKMKEMEKMIEMLQEQLKEERRERKERKKGKKKE